MLGCELAQSPNGDTVVQLSLFDRVDAGRTYGISSKFRGYGTTASNTHGQAKSRSCLCIQAISCSVALNLRRDQCYNSYQCRQEASEVEAGCQQTRRGFSKGRTLLPGVERNHDVVADSESSSYFSAIRPIYPASLHVFSRIYTRYTKTRNDLHYLTIGVDLTLTGASAEHLGQRFLTQKRHAVHGLSRSAAVTQQT